MAEAKAKKELKEPRCPICSDYFENPVTIECGHSFCSKCITKKWKGVREDFTCPECKEVFEEKEFRPNKRLARQVKFFRQIDDTIQKINVDILCDQHKKPLAFFCEDEQLAICHVCCKAEHQHHKVDTTLIPVLDYVDRIENQRKKIFSEFEELHQLLDKEKDGLLRELNLKENKIAKGIEENLAKLEEQSASLRRIIRDIEKKVNSSPIQLLKEAQTLLERIQSVKFMDLKIETSECEENFYSAPRQYMALKELAKKFQVDPADIILNIHTVNDRLEVSKDRKAVRWRKEIQKVSKSEQRFDTVPCVLGTRGYSSGRYYWEVQVDGNGDWAVGVAKKQICRKDRMPLSPSGGIWAVRHFLGQYYILTSPAIRLSLSEKVQIIRIYLDMELRQLSFYNSINKEHIYTLLLSSSKELYPFFWTSYEAEITLESFNVK
uniref:Uncharacterized protein n=1 Tax=Leptobrachium leishanense TaxID=445787 RepID=A0A8C5MQW8_9ANUR